MIRGLDTLFVLAFIADTAVLKQRGFGFFFFLHIKLHTSSESSKNYVPVQIDTRINAS